MQQQIQALQTSVTEATTKNKALENQLNALRSDLNAHKQLIEQLGQTQTGHKASIDAVETLVKDLDMKITLISSRSSSSKKAASPKKPAPKKR